MADSGRVRSALVSTYFAAREEFRAALSAVRARWPMASLEAHVIRADPHLTIDWIAAPALETRERLLIVTTGVHGIEGDVGAMILHLLLQEILPCLEPRTTGLLLIHALNPWGMAQRQKTNACNVDLNRNFVGAKGYEATFNPDYDKLRDFFCPQRRVHRRDLSTVRFALTLVGPLRRFSVARIQEAFLIGQYRHAEGIFYGGTELQEELQLFSRLLQVHLAAYPQVLYLELHTGYGPRYQMSVVNSPQERRTDRELAEQFAYPLVVRTEPGAFYAIRGDIVDGLYSLVYAQYPRKRFYGATFEFGTLGDTLWHKIRSMQTMILANQVRHHGAENAAIQALVARCYEALYAPTAAAWLEKARADARRAFGGILRAEGFLST